MNRYESYKDSGVEWLGEVPEHWDIKKLKHILNFQTGGTPSSGHTLFYDGDLPWVTISDLNGRYTNQTHFISKYGQRSANIPLTPKGSLLYSFKLSVGQVAFAHQDLYTNEAIASFLPTNNNNLNYYFYTLPIFIAKNANKNIYGADILNQELIKNSYILSIPEAEQTAIAQYLDDKTAKIDQAIMLEEKQIELLKEHKQILIQNAVTKGLNPQVKFKDSGVEWLGEVPEHWEVKKLKFITKINQKTLSEETNGNLEIEYIDIGSISFENGVEKTEHFLFKNAPSRARRLADIGDTVISTVRTYLKAIVMVKNEYKHCVFSTGFAVVKPNKDLHSKYFELYAKSDAFTEQVSISSKGMSYPAINATDLSNLWVAIPPLSEQTAIAHYLDEQTAKIDHAIQLKQQQIDKLKEYKTVLINDVVTGKVKVA